MRIIGTKVGIVAVLILCGSLFVAAQSATKKTAPASAAADYCTSTGGAVETRVPSYGTNGPPTSWLKLAGRQEFCRYTASDHSHIHLNLETLFTPQPTLAALAYYAEVPWNGIGGGTPASLYCTQLGGTDLFGGINAAGGGWVALGTVDEVLDACIFPDNSTIDSWGLFYHSDAIVRGIDLSTVLKYANPYGKSKGETK
jgi:putative hemolysin